MDYLAETVDNSMLACAPDCRYIEIIYSVEPHCMKGKGATRRTRYVQNANPDGYDSLYPSYESLVPGD